MFGRRDLERRVRDLEALFDEQIEWNRRNNEILVMHFKKQHGIEVKNPDAPRR